MHVGIIIPCFFIAQVHQTKQPQNHHRNSRHLLHPHRRCYIVRLVGISMGYDVNNRRQRIQLGTDRIEFLPSDC